MKSGKFIFFLLDNCKRVCLRYRERVRKSENKINETLFTFDIPTTILCLFPISPISCLFNDIESSVCN